MKALWVSTENLEQGVGFLHEAQRLELGLQVFEVVSPSHAKRCDVVYFKFGPDAPAELAHRPLCLPKALLFFLR